MSYIETHPWITFKLDLRRASHRIWLLLGEAQSKCEHIANSPLQPDIARHLHQVSLAKGAQATTAIEGNSLSEEEVMKQIEGKLELPSSKKYLGQEIDNVIDACNIIMQTLVEKKDTKINVEMIKEFNLQVLKKLPLSEEIEPGIFRKHNVVVGKYWGVDPKYCETLVKQLCDWLNNAFKPEKSHDKAYGILKAIVAHIYIAWIHPFSDGNGRTARLVELFILFSVGIPSAAAHLLSNHYNQTRSEYYRQLDRASKTKGDIMPFIEYALQGYVDELKEHINIIQAQQLSVHWRDYIYDTFREKDSPTDRRRRKLILELAIKINPVPLDEIRHLSPQIAELYATKTKRTLHRDIIILQNMDLIVLEKKGYRAKFEKILSFLPASI